MTLLRHLFAIIVLPFTMTVLIPRWVVSGYGLRPFWPSDATAALGQVAGAVCFLAGFSLFAWCLYLFAMRGKGTLAPWDPPKHLVVAGPYRHVRNPMISGVLMMLAGETLFLGSGSIAWWLFAFFVINQVTFLVHEEPRLEKRFGEEYIRYKSQVPRWAPRLRPFNPEF